MDQNKKNLPHFHRKSKSAAALSFLKTHITGSLIHDYGGLGYIDLLQWPHDSNLMLTVLLDAIQRRLQQRSYFPSKLFIQLDNTCRENKNQFVLTFLAVVVQLGLFKEVQVGFLMVGHTHEDIDQLFSCVSRYLDRHSAYKLPGNFFCNDSL